MIDVSATRIILRSTRITTEESGTRLRLKNNQKLSRKGEAYATCTYFNEERISGRKAN